jgi:hypothetical protein
MAVRQRPRVGDPHEAVIPTAEAGAPRTTWAGKEPTTETSGELRVLFTTSEASRPGRSSTARPGRARQKAKVHAAGRHGSGGRQRRQAARCRDGRVQLIFNTPRGKGARTDEGRIRAASVLYGVPCITTLPAAEACVRDMEAMRAETLSVQPIQDRSPGEVHAEPG